MVMALFCCYDMARRFAFLSSFIITISISAFNRAYISIPSASFRRQLRPATRNNMVHVEQRLQELGIVLPPAPKAAANYIPAQTCGNLLFLSGHLPVQADGGLMTGKIGSTGKSIEHGYASARQVGLNLLATMQQELGDLDRVEKIIKLLGIVQSMDDFKEQHKVINGCSDLMVEVFGPAGIHARSAIGSNCLPLDISVEVEAIVQFKL